MEIYFRIIEWKSHQVLLTKDFDDSDESSPILKVEVFIDGGKVSFSLGYDDEDRRNKTFDEFTIEQAGLLLDSILNDS